MKGDQGTSRRENSRVLEFYAFVQYILHILKVAIMVSCRQCTTVLGVTHYL